MKDVLKHMPKDGEGSDSGIGSDDNERLGAWDPPEVSGVDNGKPRLNCEDIVSSNVGRKAEVKALSSACAEQFSLGNGCRQWPWRCSLLSASTGYLLFAPLLLLGVP